MSDKPSWTMDQQMLFNAISETVGIFQSREQMHTTDMTRVFDWWAKWSREATKTSDRQGG